MTAIAQVETDRQAPIEGVRSVDTAISAGTAPGLALATSGKHHATRLSPLRLIAAACACMEAEQCSAGAVYGAEGFCSASVHSDEERWGLEFLHMVGTRSFPDSETATPGWPLPLADSVDDLARLAEARRVLFDVPRPCDVFVLWSPVKKRYVRSGIAIAVDSRVVRWPNGRRGYECRTIECVAVLRDHHVVPMVTLRQRRLSPDAGDRVVRWTNLEPERVCAEEAE